MSVVRIIRVVVVVVALCVTAVLVRAQVPGYPNGCASCVVYSWIDNPAQGDVPSVRRSTDWIIGGWGFLCQSGGPVDRADVWYRADDGEWTPALGTYEFYYGPRPDVFGIFWPSCPALAYYESGFSAVYRDTWRLPLGERDVMLYVWRGPYFEAHVRRIRVVP